LNRSKAALREASPATDAVVLVESKRMTTGRNWHPARLYFLISSARHFAKQLEVEGFSVRYLQAATTVDGLDLARADFGNLPIVAAEASSFRQLAELTEYGVEWVENDLFLTTRKLFGLWASAQKSFVMENFYRAQRNRLGILVDGGKPAGGAWNYDADNRLPPPKNHNWPERLTHEPDQIDLEVGEQVGYRPDGTWATTREGALRQLDHYIEHHLSGFGPYEDAVTSDDWSLNHSLLSPYLNNGLLHAEEVIRPAIDAYQAGKAPIQSVEAFVRQVIGWREYINGMYWFLGEDYRELNNLGADLALPPLFHDSTKTHMKCVKAAVHDVEQRAWTHHIPRLMILSNLALITGTNPQQFLNWMREQFIDASEWVMVPNVIGMATHADGGLLMTKPYAAGGAYLSRMTNHCKGCVYNPKLRTGSDACPFTTLYWDFLDRHGAAFAKNHRMQQQVNGLKRLTDLPELRVRAKQVLEGISNGTI
jgi:deoxyribodipyrimidine photolyase-related protein